MNAAYLSSESPSNLAAPHHSVRSCYRLLTCNLDRLARGWLAFLAFGLPLPAQTAHYQRPETVLGNGVETPRYSIAVDGQGNVYIPEGTYVLKVPPTDQRCLNNNPPDCIPMGNTPGFYIYGVAVDDRGYVYLSSSSESHYNIGQVQKVPPTDPPCSNSCSPIGGGWELPWGIAVDPKYDVYVADQQRKVAVEEQWSASAQGYTPQSLGSGLAGPVGVALGKDGAVYIAGYGSNAIEKVTANGANATQLNLPTVYAQGLAVDSQNNIYIADKLTNTLVMEMWTGHGYKTSTAVNIGVAFDSVAVDGSGNLYATEATPPFAALEFGAPVIDFGNLTEKTQSQPLTATFVFDTAGTVGSVLVTTDGSTPALTPLGQDFFLSSVNVIPHLGAVLPCKAGTTYQVGEMCTLAVEFQPFAATSYTGTAGLKNPAGQLIASVSLVGTGLLPEDSKTLVCVTKDACGDVVAPNPIFGGGEYGVVSKQNATGGMCVVGKVLPAAQTFCAPGSLPAKGTPVK